MNRFPRLVRTRYLALLVLVSMLMASIPVSQAQANMVRGPLFGGMIIDANTSSEAEMSLAEAPAVAHVFTATWCEPCVDVEYGLANVSEQVDVVTLEFHRFTGETEDPFGSASEEDWWMEWFQTQNLLQPTVRMNGGEAMVGTVEGRQENLLVAATAAQGEFAGNVDASWDSTSSTLLWNLDVDENSLVCDEVEAFAHIVERTAYFPQGSNLMENYTHIVHGVIDIGGSSGTHVFQQLPTAYDGDDLDVILVFGCWITPVEEENDAAASLPFLGSVAAATLIVAAAMSRRLD